MECLEKQQEIYWRISMEEKIIIRRAKINDFQGIHKLIMQVHKLLVNEKNDI